MKISKSELVQIIQEEAVKVKKVKLLEAEKASIVKRLNEIYGGDIPGEELDEKFLGMGTDWTNEEEVSQKFADNAKKRFEKSGAPLPNWATPGTDSFKKAVQAAMSMKTVDIQWNPTYKQFTKIGHKASGHVFGGGGQTVRL